MRPIVVLTLVLNFFLLFGCSHPVTTVLIDRVIDEPKVVAVDAPRTPWVTQIELRLKQRGFRILRWSSVKQVQQQVDKDTTEQFNSATTRYVLQIEGRAYMDPMHRCFGGGFEFEYISADLIDVKTNETIANFSGSGFSEGCPPASGTIFSDVAEMVAARWKGYVSNRHEPADQDQANR